MKTAVVRTNHANTVRVYFVEDAEQWLYKVNVLTGLDTVVDIGQKLIGLGYHQEYVTTVDDYIVALWINRDR